MTRRLLALAMVAVVGMVLLASDLGRGRPDRISIAPAVAALEQSDFARAYHLLRPFAENGEVRAQLLLAVMYARGEGAPRDVSKAHRWLRRAAQNGDPRARAWLARDLSLERQSAVELARQLHHDPR
ncbi:MAG: hypothetical protein QNJ92_07595 [Alphaproteobacteria bacterium]|nr:hypothetical protein [Alphaproteobacteria bacterium]